LARETIVSISVNHRRESNRSVAFDGANRPVIDGPFAETHEIPEAPPASLLRTARA
jgi:hypothetical protein